MMIMMVISPLTGAYFPIILCFFYSICRSGVLQAGDRILSINGIRTEFMSSEEFHRAVFESGTSLRMEIEFDVTGKCSLVDASQVCLSCVHSFSFEFH